MVVEQKLKSPRKLKEPEEKKEKGAKKPSLEEEKKTEDPPGRRSRSKVKTPINSKAKVD